MTGEIVERLKALTALLEDQGSIPSFYMAFHPSVTPVLGDKMPSSGLQWHKACWWYTDMFPGKIHTKDKNKSQNN